LVQRQRTVEAVCPTVPGVERFWEVAVCQNPGTPVVHIKIAGKWMFIPLKMVLIGIDPYPSEVAHHVFRKGVLFAVFFVEIPRHRAVRNCWFSEKTDSS